MTKFQSDTKTRTLADKARFDDTLGNPQLLALQEDWVELVSADFSYSSDNVLTTSEDYSDRLQIGDKVKLLQDGDTKYFYVVSRTSSTVTLNAGNAYTYENEAITELFYSKFVSPSGFPSSFDYTPTYSGIGSSPTVTRTSGGMMYWIQGGIIWIWGDVSFSLGGTVDAITISYPFTLGSTFTNHNPSPFCRIANGALGTLVNHFGRLTVGSTASFNIYRLDGSCLLYTYAADD